jgi:hypothetical protein
MIFSIFGPPLLVQLFVEEWHHLTGMIATPGGPWYEGRMLQYHASDFDGKSVTALEVPEGTRFRLASLQDLPAVSELCRQFSVVSVCVCYVTQLKTDSIVFRKPPYELTGNRAEYHAHHLITRGQIWVCEVVPQSSYLPPGQLDVLLDSTPGDIVSICAVTRETNNVAAITKTLTHPNARRRGYAQHLLRHISEK